MNVVLRPVQIRLQVITDTSAYKDWNPFVERCESSFVVDEAIVMHVRLVPLFLLRQKETIFANEKEQLLEYGVRVPGLLRSSRKHILIPQSDGAVNYQSLFILSGLYRLS